MFRLRNTSEEVKRKQMKYDLPILNNISDSMGVVCAEMDCFFDLLHDENYFCWQSVKHVILNLANCFELLVKYRLWDEHWCLLYSDVTKAKYSEFCAGDFVSIDVMTGIKRLQNICEVKVNASSCLKIQQYRNKLMHFTLLGEVEEIIINISTALSEITQFYEAEIKPLVSDEAKKDFETSISQLQEKSLFLQKIDLASIISEF